MLFAQLSSAVVREFGFMQAPDHEEAAACCAPLQRKGLAGGRCQAEEDAVVAFTFGKFPQWASAPEHVIDGIENKGFAGIGRAIEHVEARFEAHGCRRPLRPEKAQMTDLQASKVAHDAPMLRSNSWNSMIQFSKYRRMIALNSSSV